MPSRAAPLSYNENPFLPLSSQHICNLHRVSVIPRGNLNARPLCGSVNYLSVPYVHRHMVNAAYAASLKQQIAGLHLIRTHLDSLGSLPSGGPAHRNTRPVLEHVPGKS